MAALTGAAKSFGDLPESFASRAASGCSIVWLVRIPALFLRPPHSRFGGLLSTFGRYSRYDHTHYFQLASFMGSSWSVASWPKRQSAAGRRQRFRHLGIPRRCNVPAGRRRLRPIAMSEATVAGMLRACRLLGWIAAAAAAGDTVIWRLSVSCSFTLCSTPRFIIDCSATLLAPSA